MAIIASRTRAASHSDYQHFRSSYPEFCARLQAILRIRDLGLSKLGSLVGRARHARVRKLLRDQRFHLLYAYQGTRKARQLRDATPASIQALAESWAPSSVSREPTPVFWVPGRNEQRRVVAFGPRRRMHQGLVADLLRTLHPPLEQQCLFRGGMPIALRAVEAAINEGYVFGAEVDVSRFYASIQLDGLAELLRPLPTSVVHGVVWDSGIRRSGDGDYAASWSADDPSLNGLVGLAPGAATSPIVGECIIARLLAACRGYRTVAYADNIIVLGRDVGEVRACLQHLAERAETLETGPLRLRIDEVQSLSERFEFLHQVGEREEQRFFWSPDQRKLNEYLAAYRDEDVSLEAVAEAEAKISHWRRAYPSWPNGDEWEIQRLAELAAKRFYKAAEPLNRSHAAHSLILAYFASGRIQSLEEIVPEGGSEAEERRRGELVEEAARRLNVISRRHGPMSPQVTPRPYGGE